MPSRGSALGTLKGAQPWTRQVRRLVAPAVVMLVGVSWLSVDMFVITTADSLVYLEHSTALTERGFVTLGYRQVGYPLFLAGSELVGRMLGAEPLVGPALVQRLALGVGIVYLVWLWRWWALPLVALAAVPSFVTYTNALLTEGLAIGLTVILAALLLHGLALVEEPSEISGNGRSQRTLVVVAWLVSLVAGALLFTRFTYAVFGFAPLLLFGAMSRRQLLSWWTALPFLAFILAAAALTFALTLENRTEFGELSPSTRTSRAEYWSAWEVVFGLTPSHKLDPQLTEFYDGGNPYTFIRRIDRLASVDEQDEAFDGRIEQMLRRAGMNRNGQRLLSFLGSVRGGRIDDYRVHIERAERAASSRIQSAIHQSVYSRTEGADAFEARFTDGRPVGAVITSGVAPSPVGIYFTAFLSLLLPASLVILVLAAGVRRSRFIAVSGLVPFVATSVAAGWALADNVRFLLPAVVWAIAFSGPALGAVTAHSPRTHAGKPQGQRRRARTIAAGSATR